MTLKIFKTIDAKYYGKKFSELLERYPELHAFLISTDPPKFDLGDPKILSLLNHYLYKEILQLEVSVPEGFLIPALGIRHVYCEVIDEITDSEDPLIEIGTGASAVLAMILAKKYKRNVIATEINDISIKSANKNVRVNSLSKFISILQSRGEILTNLLPEGNYSTLLCYPPIYDNDQTKLWKKRGWKGVESEMFGGTSNGMDFTLKLLDEALNSDELKFRNITVMLMNEEQIRQILAKFQNKLKSKIFQINAGTRKRFVLWIQNY
ncbi:MAG: RlmF-related methyltransferase [Candidatus Heimdallarchaeota archaeon]|nr:RlmF-related methyltransferase [Candidatus Heimdallarchaeota archaeon]MCK4254966.1 RlmF-related methyltransferase [Candidatus Heimdallarchaeota archaeon]